MNIIFMPIPILEGMAGSRRLNNYLEYFLKVRDIKIYNIVFNRTLSSPKLFLSSKINVILIKDNFFIYPFAIIKTIIQFMKVYKKKKRNIIYFYGYPDISNILYLIVAKIIGFKIVFDIVENRFEKTNFNSFLNKLRLKSSRFIFILIRNHVDGFICISEIIKEYLLSNLIITKPIILIPITIKKGSFNIERKKKNKYIKIFYGGSFGKKDGIEFLLKAFDKIADQFDIKIYLSGKGSISDKENLNCFIRKMHNKSKVIQTGFLPYEEYIKLMCSCDINCVTRIDSKYANAGFPFKLGEMLASGNPVIVTRVGEIDTFLDDKSSVIVNPNSVVEIENALSFLIKNPLEREKIGCNGKRSAFEKFDSLVHSKRLYHFLHTI